MAKLQFRTISNRMVAALKVGKDTVFWDRELTGFGVRVYPSGARVYVAQTRGPGGPGGPKRVTVGRRGDFRGPGAPAGGADHRPRQGGRGADPRAHGAADGADGGGQSRTKPFRLARLSVKPDPDDLQRLCRTRVEEIEGFVEGLFGDEESVDVPESASEALDHLAEINASMHGCRI